AAGSITKFVEEIVVAACEDHVTVAGLEHLVRHDARMRIAETRWIFAGRQMGHRLVGKESHAGVEQRHVYPLPFAGHRTIGERGTDSNGRVHAGREVDDGNTDTLRTASWHAVGLTGDAHEPAHTLCHEIVARPVFVWASLAKAGYRAIDDAGVDC